MFDAVVGVPAIVLAAVIWVMQHLFAAQPFQLPAEILKAVKAMDAAAVKWEAVADAILSWHLLVIAAIAFFFGWLVGGGRSKE